MQPTKKDIKKINIDFNQSTIDFDNLPSNPYFLFHNWFNEIVKIDQIEAISLVLSTCSNNTPSSRVVFLKEFSDSSFTFFTNYNSKKSQDIDRNSNVALNFNWASLQRQVRILGKAKKMNKNDSDNYFKTRSRQSQLASHLSNQSSKIDMNTNYELLLKDINNQYLNKDISRPEEWGGYLVFAETIEFWQGRPSRLHDRIKYYQKDSNWLTERLAP